MRSIGKSMALVGIAILFCGCAGTTIERSGCQVAVWELENLTIGRSSSTDLGPALTTKVMEGLQSGGACTVVERQKLDTALAELSLGSSALAAENTRLKVGRLVGARQMVFGAFQILGNQMRLDLRLVDVATGEVINTAEASAPADERISWLRAAGQATRHLVQGGW
jgi:curli biogenesis system outer membrane secretion channel CsgG